MEETITIPASRLEYLEERAKKLAREKSYLQLIIRLMNKVSAAQGLENTVEALLGNILDVIGSTNIILYYRIDENFHYADVLGKRIEVTQIDDELVLTVFATHEAIEREHDFRDTMLLTSEFTKAYTWVYPLMVGTQAVGVLKMENLHIAMRDLFQMLPTLFNFIALLLNNEIQGYVRLKQAYDQLSDSNVQLEMEIEERERVEEELIRARDELEERVEERTTELSEANEKLGRELSERMYAEGEVKHLKNYLSNIIDSMPSMLVGIDQNERVTQWNRRAEMTTGISAADALGKQIAELFPDFYPWIKSQQGEIEQRRPAYLEKLLLEKADTRSFYDLMLYPLISKGVTGTVIRIEDVTERTRIQELMIQTEKMMSVGGLAAGMAHEINNPLGIITQAAQNIERRVSPELAANREAASEAGISLYCLDTYFRQRQIPEFIGSIREAAARASRIITNILRFSRSTDSTMQPKSLIDIMEQALELAVNDYDLKKKYDFRSITIVRDFAPNMPDVPVVATEIEQVLLNLLKNAAQAMNTNQPDRPPGIVLRIRWEERYAVVEVEDNGSGMTEDVRRRVFEPFFTTKEPGTGTGLGLSVSYMIITQNHKGLMEAVSTPGNGARFIIRLPFEKDSRHEC